MHKLAETCIRRPVFATMLIMALTVIGAFSFFGLNVDLIPKVDVPTVSVTVSNPGSSPEQIETEITKKLEGAVNTISGIEDLRSYSSEGVAQVVVSFSLDKDGDVAAQEIRDKIGTVVGQLPETARLPVVQKFDPDANPILRVVVSASRPLREVTTLAEKQIKEPLESIAGVGQITITGGARRAINVQVDPDRMRAYSVTIAEVANALRQQNLEVPGGRVDEGARELTVRTLGRLSDAKAFNNIAVATRGAYVVRLSDIGEAFDSEEEVRSTSKLNDQPAVTLIVSKQSGENVVAVADGVKERLKEIARTLPKDVKTEIIADQSLFIKSAVEAIESHLIEGSLLASFVIFLFLSNIRTTLIAAIAIPTSIIATFGLMKAMDYTLNRITMLALTLMVGIVIDDAIIVLENIYRFIEEKKMPPFQAAIEGTREIGLAVMATTLSLLAVFVPVGFMGGIVGRFMSSFGLTAAFAIAVSLLVSFTLTPMLSARFLKPTGGDSDKHDSKQSWLFSHIDRIYNAMLDWSLAHRKTMVALSTVVVFSVVPLFMFIGKNFQPDDDRAEFEIGVAAPEGTSLAATGTILDRIAREVRTLRGVTGTLTTAGGGSLGSVNSGSVYVKMIPEEERDYGQQDVMVEARNLLKKFPAELRTSVAPAGGWGNGRNANAQFQYTLTGPDLDQLAKYSNALLEKLKSVPDAADADTSLVLSKPELRVEIDRERAADLGVRAGDIAQALNTLVAGQTVSTFDAGIDQYDVRLRAGDASRSSAEALKRLIVASTKSGWVNLEDVIRIREGEAPSVIERLNRQRQVTLTANIAPGGSQAKIISAVDEGVRELNMEPGYGAAAAGMSKELGRAGYYFVLAISLSFIFMYMVLAAQFESFLHPITILLTLPIAIPFGIVSLLMFGQTINIFSGLGLLLLFGIVKKNAILQIDHTNGLRAKGYAIHEAIIQANRDRLRPILMTTVSLVAGMLPLVVGNGPGAASNRSIGVLVAGGQSLCLLLTLLIVPVMYSLFEDWKKLPFWAWLGRRMDAVGARIGAVAGVVWPKKPATGGLQ
jgi:hydrophobic/amphiphilic exporter-1 (mainly G- bacteria), HAE1 family